MGIVPNKRGPVSLVVLFACVTLVSPAMAEEAKMPSDEEMASIQQEVETDSFFAPMWTSLGLSSQMGFELPPEDIASIVHVSIWRSDCQKAIGLSAEQKATILAINAKYLAEQRKHQAQWLAMPADQRDTEACRKQAKQWGKAFSDGIRREIEASLTAKQVESLKEFGFVAFSVESLYRGKIRRVLGLTAEQEKTLQRVYIERLSRVQNEQLKHADKAYAVLTPEQHAKFLELRQGPTSAVLSLANDLGFYYGLICQSYPMLAMQPVRERLKVDANQEKKLSALMTESARKQQAAMVRSRQNLAAAMKETTNSPTTASRAADADDMNVDDSAQIEAILTPKQIAALKDIDLRRRMLLALGYADKRKTLGITDPQTAELNRIDRETIDGLRRIESEMIRKPLDVLTPVQQTKLREMFNRAGR